jgi:hypothetical protein
MGTNSFRTGLARKRPVRAYIYLLRGAQSPSTAYTRAILRAIGWGPGEMIRGGAPFGQILKSMFFSLFRRALGGVENGPEMAPGRTAQMQACVGITGHIGGCPAGGKWPECTPGDDEFHCIIMNFSVHFDFEFRRAACFSQNLALYSGFGGGAPFWRGRRGGHFWLQKATASMIPGQIEMGLFFGANFGCALSAPHAPNPPVYS